MYCARCRILATVHAVIMAYKGQLRVHNRMAGILGLIVQIDCLSHNSGC